MAPTALSAYLSTAVSGTERGKKLTKSAAASAVAAGSSRLNDKSALAENQQYPKQQQQQCGHCSTCRSCSSNSSSWGVEGDPRPTTATYPHPRKQRIISSSRGDVCSVFNSPSAWQHPLDRTPKRPLGFHLSSKKKLGVARVFFAPFSGVLEHLQPGAGRQRFAPLLGHVGPLFVARNTTETRIATKTHITTETGGWGRKKEGGRAGGKEGTKRRASRLMCDVFHSFTPLYDDTLRC